MGQKFFGREQELAQLRRLQKKSGASLVVVRGRRRIGKSRLLEEFGKEMKSLFFTGLPPNQHTTAQTQRNEFAKQLERAGIHGIRSDDWSDLFWNLSAHTQRGRILIVLDEISWMGGKDPDFLGKLKTMWDLHFSKNSKLVLVLCGSISSWIEENILKHTGFLGRISLDLVLEEMSLQSCNQFWGAKKSRVNPLEKFKILSVTGGVPLYLEQILPSVSSEKNIFEMCFERGSLLYREFENIFSDLFSKKSKMYKEIIYSLSGASKSQSTILSDLGKSHGGVYTNYLEDLVSAGFIKKDFTWNFETGKTGRDHRYRLSDNYLRFYLKYILPNQSKIEKGIFAESSISTLRNWEGIMGLQFENLVSHNRKDLIRFLEISSSEIVMEGPFFQKPTIRKKGCQIDYMIQTKFNTLYVCEVKFLKKRVGVQVIEEVQEKIDKLKLPRSFSVRPTLIHVNGVTDELIEEDYFDKVIDFGQFLVGE